MAAGGVTSGAPGQDRLWRLRLGGISVRVSPRVLALMGLALVALGLLAAWAITLGSFRLPVDAILQALAGQGTRDADFVVLSLRLPRILSAVLVGMLLAQSGAIFQGLVRNPLASPDIIGINAGASLAAVFWIVTHQPDSLLPLAAFSGALAAAAAVYGLSWRGKISNSRLILVGIGMNALLTAGVTLLVVRTGINDVSKAYQWMTGSVYASSWADVRMLALAAGLLVLLGMGLMWPLRVMQIGDLTARSLGTPLERTRLLLALVGCALSAAAISAAGPVGFIALMVPHIARMLAGPMTGGVFLLSGLLGSILLLGADMVGQHALPVGLPVGVLTAALGAPYFLFLLYRSNVRL